jgi:hypothetical protein
MREADLVTALRSLADQGHPTANLLRRRADELEAARAGYLAAPAPYDGGPLREFNRAFGLAYHLWSVCSGAAVS